MTEKHMKQAIENVELNKIYYKVIATLPLQSKIVLALCIKFKVDNNSIYLNNYEHYRLYTETCKAFGIDALMPHRVQDLINELNMLGIIKINHVSRWKETGIPRKITLKAPCETIIKALSSDERIQTILTS
jgi:Cdc6-like AAA superfamily ATPase